MASATATGAFVYRSEKQSLVTRTATSEHQRPSTLVMNVGQMKMLPQQLTHQAATPPSIPTQNQSFGYEEGTSGTLVLQKPSDPIHTGEGEGIDKVGPGSYDVPTNTLGGPKVTAVAWGNSKTKRDIVPKSSVPGPGSYNPSGVSKPSSNAIVVTINGVDLQFGGSGGSSQFASKVPLNANRKPLAHQITPGPGAYQVESMGKKGQRPPHDMQFFGATSKRASQIDPTKSLAAPSYFRNPGPGAYEESRRAVSARASLSDPKPFQTTAQRFKSPSTIAPGPGEYKPDYIQNLVKDIEDRAVISRGGVFGSTAARWNGNFHSKSARFVPKGASTAVDSSDQSMAAMGVVKGDPSRLGPGSYLEHDSWSKKSHHPGYKKAAFGSETKRGGIVGRPSTTTPGPGRYNQSVDVNKALDNISYQAM
eukprot:gene4422-14554_t